MNLFKNQILKRREQEDIALREVNDELNSQLHLNHRGHSSQRTDSSAIRQLLAALGIEEYHLEQDEMVSQEEQFREIVSQNGILVRRVKLTHRWWRCATGPMLGYDKEHNLVALMPTRLGLGYTYVNKEGEKVKVNVERAKNELDESALAFLKPLPNKELTVKDLLRYSYSVVPKSDIAMLLLASVVVLVFGMFTPFANKLLFDTIIPSGVASDLWPVAALLVGAAVAMTLFTVTRNLLIMRINNHLKLNLQNAVMARLFMLHPNFFWNYPSGNLSMRVNSISSLCSFFNESVIGSFLTAIFSLGYFIQIFLYAKPLLVPSLIIIGVQVALMVWYYRVSANSQRKILGEQTKLSGLRYNIFAGIQKIKVTGSEKRAYVRWLKNYVRCARLRYNPRLVVRLLPALVSFVSTFGYVVIFYFTVANKVATSDYIAFAAAFGSVSGAILSLSLMMPSLSQLEPLFNLSKPILESMPEIYPSMQRVDKLAGNIEVSNLSFRYSPDMPMVLKNINLSIKAGEYVGIVGKSGCGKSTLLRLMLGFEKPLSGGIFYDSYDLQKVDKPSLRRRIGCCLQNGSLFIGDLFQNITITAPWSTRKQAWEALHMASMDKEVKALPMGLNTVVSEGGGGFSGGQKQRLLIARALIGKPSIVFFDEATSALDNISQKQVSDNMDTLHCTRVIIAHRLSTIRNCDRIIVLDQGSIAEEGTFDELMAKRGLFYEMSQRQMT